MSTQKSSSSKTVLITGASTGFGRDTAETLTSEGHRVFASFRDIAGRNQPHADALQAKGIKVVERVRSRNGKYRTPGSKFRGASYNRITEYAANEPG